MVKQIFEYDLIVPIFSFDFKMSSKDLPDDILSKFLEEKKAAEQKKKKPQKNLRLK